MERRFAGFEEVAEGVATLQLGRGHDGNHAFGEAAASVAAGAETALAPQDRGVLRAVTSMLLLKRRFRIVVEVEPLLLRDVESSEERWLGCYTTRFERAPEPVAAVVAAIGYVKRKVEELGALNPPERQPQYRAVKVVEVSPLSLKQMQGFGFYPLDPDNPEITEDDAGRGRVE